ncbi:MAG: carbon storage regulator [Bryobacteraceae bacterium]
MMKRRAGESILIGEDIEIHLAHIGRTRVKIGIQAPRDVPVVAKEVKLVRDQNRAAAESRLEGTLARLVSRVSESGIQGTVPPADERQ